MVQLDFRQVLMPVESIVLLFRGSGINFYSEKHLYEYSAKAFKKLCGSDKCLAAYKMESKDLLFVFSSQMLSKITTVEAEVWESFLNKNLDSYRDKPVELFDMLMEKVKCCKEGNTLCLEQKS